MSPVRRRFASGVLLSAALAGGAVARAQKAASDGRWVGTWACSQQIPEPQNALPAADLQDATLRQIVHVSVGGTRLRVHLSNAFGTAPLHVGAARVARPVSALSGEIDATTDAPLTFDGKADVVIPAGAEYISDPLAMNVGALSDLAITLYIPVAPVQQTGHPGSRETSFVAHGDVVSATQLPDAKKVEHWFFLSGIDVTRGSAAVVTLGDSITDGHGATVNGNDRWPDVLAQRLQAAKRAVGVLNQGIGGNHLLTDGLGPNVLARFDRDVLAQPGVRTVIVFEGINDLGYVAREGDVPPEAHEELERRMIGAYQQIILRAHEHGLKVVGATITPDGGSDYYHPSAANEADRMRVNEWIRRGGHFDAVLDFDKVVADPQDPRRLLPAFDSGDHLHPSPAGYRALATSIPLDLLTQP